VLCPRTQQANLPAYSIFTLTLFIAERQAFSIGGKDISIGPNSLPAVAA